MVEGADEDRELRRLMKQYQHADAAALEELVRRISPALLRYFSALQANLADAEDTLQDCWIRIHRSRHTYRDTEPVMPWVYAIARHTKLDEYRKRRRRESREVLVAAVPERSSPSLADPPELDAVDRLVASLPEAQREVIVMLKVNGMSLEEVARATSSTVGAVKQGASRVHHAAARIEGSEECSPLTTAISTLNCRRGRTRCPAPRSHRRSRMAFKSVCGRRLHL